VDVKENIPARPSIVTVRGRGAERLLLDQQLHRRPLRRRGVPGLLRQMDFNFFDLERIEVLKAPRARL
jgi:hypothetical protein